MQDILKRAGMTDYKSLSTPIPTSKSIPIDATPYDDLTQYMSLAGALQYLTITRPDLSFAVNQLCQQMHAPTTTHWEQLKRVLRIMGCKKQRTVTRSSIVAEYKALADICAEVIWITSLLHEIRVTGISVPKLWCDNLGATYMCANPIFHARTKHVEIDYHFVRDKVAIGEIQVNLISTKDQLADIFTKALHGPRFSFIRDKLQVTSVPALEGEY
ncbi:PREDICTED: uncharacterized protein LOC109193915 [Ipomoea nil]|uniref:uncharacterized protein LOC109193915 n=1 Tax=Ipomoea nil TaxID=35883 RepID=UPI000901BAD3|nr:PREDICTED: uncharacterized protein LOC109193915 [Ipomoea nil]